MNNFGSVKTLQDLLFRRQFLLSPLQFNPTGLWNCSSLKHSLVLSVHPDLDIYTESQGKVSATLVGFAVDPLFPQKTMRDIARTMASEASNIDEAIHLTNSLAGRWVVIFQDQKGTYLFTDPCGFRTVFYFSDAHGFWCGSQPEIIKANTSLEWNSEEGFLDFLIKQHLIDDESLWIGNKTIYDHCYRLMPNHYLDVNHSSQIRFSPVDIPNNDRVEAIIERASLILQGTYEAIILQKKSVIQALTAGWDSRVLLAASRQYSQNIQYFVDCEGVLPENHPDVWVPKRLAQKLNINFEIKNSTIDPPGWFISVLSQNITCARILPKTRTIFAHFNSGETRMHINGNGSEICRDYPSSPFPLDHSYLTHELAKIYFFHDYPNPIPFVEDEIENWKKDLFSKGGESISVLNLIYWEQRLGTWGAQYSSEQEIAIDQFSPFNCRLLIETLLTSPQQMRCRPSYLLYKELIRAMWPEALSVPINPGKGNRLFRIKNRIRPYIPSSALHAVTQVRMASDRMSKILKKKE